MQKFKNLGRKKSRQEKPLVSNKTYRKSHVPFRLNLLFFVIFALFATLIVRLGYLQIVDGESLDKQLKEPSTITVKGSTPRGMIYDASGNPLVENKANAAITFTRGVEMGAEDLLQTATKLNKLIKVDVDKALTERDLKDYWLANPEHLEDARDRLKDKEQSKDPTEEYNAIVTKVTADEIKFDQEELKIATIFKKLNGAQQLTTVFVKNQDVTNEELAVVSEHSQELPGISTGTDWTRQTVTKNVSLATVIGRVSTDGLQADTKDEYLEKGYALNDRVGVSYLEKQYEEVLQGTKSQHETLFNNEGKIQSQKELSSGAKGDNLVLTIDAEFQNKVDEIVKDAYQKLINNGSAVYSPGIYVVAINPKNGAILALSGYYHDLESNEVSEDAIGVYQHAFEPGSVMKAATLTAGWQNNVIKGNQVIYDQPIYLQSSPVKASIFNKTGSNNRSLTAIQALELSSNSYMMQIALRLMDIDYMGQSLSMPTVPNQVDVYKKLRAAMASYGMGVKTGIDLPNEGIGLQPDISTLNPYEDGAKVLDLAFGQFDTYTALQLAQYVATIANDGKRLRPHLVQGIYSNDEKGNLGELKEEIKPEVLNEVDLSKENMELIQKGFYQVVHGNDPFTTARSLMNAKMDLAAKTGTAEKEATVNGMQIDVENLNMVAYGPADDPEIALAVTIPQLRGTQRGTPNQDVTMQIMNAYYDHFIAK